MRCQLATWVPVGNFGPSMQSVMGLVVHVQEGNGSPESWFDNPVSEASSHFWVSKTGQIEQYVDTTSQAWAQEQGDPDYLSVETEGFHTEPLEPAQMTSLTNLISWVCAVYLLPIALVDHGQMGITTHAHYPSGVPDLAWGDHPCPGTVRSGQLPAVLPSPSRPTPAPSSRGDQMSAIVVQSTGNQSEWLADTTAGTIRYFATGEEVQSTLAGIGQAKVATWSPALLSTYQIVGAKGPGVGL